jgi:hypothetical protein
LLVPAQGAFAVACGADLRIVDPALGLRQAAGLETGLRSVAALAADGDWIAVGGCSLVLFRLRSVVGTVQMYRGSVCAVAVSEAHGVAVAGTSDGAIVIVALATVSTVRALELGALVPHRIVVSPSWGFIVSYCQEIVAGAVRHVIVVHTINGAPVARACVPAPVEAWTCWATWDAFDFIAVATAGGLIDVAEVRFLAFKRCCCPCQAQIIALQYAPVYALIVAVAATGQLCFLPWAPP